MSNIDKKLIQLMNKLYDMSKEEIEDFKLLLTSFTEQEKEDLAMVLWQRLKEEESIFKKIFRKLKIFNYNLDEIETKKWADDLLIWL